MENVEVIDFNVPNGKGSLLVLIDIETRLDKDSLHLKLYEIFSKFGLLFQVKVDVSANSIDASPSLFAYIRYYSVRSCNRARTAVQSNRINLTDFCGPAVRIRKSQARPGVVPLLRFRCEELANHYLGFNGWSSKILYHRQEHSDPLTIKFVSVVRLEFHKHGLWCEGAGLIEESLLPDDLVMQRVNVAKRSIGEAFFAAWGKVILLVVNDHKVHLEIDTTKKDSFFYNPLWDQPEVVVNDVEYANVDQEEQEENKE
eukprot:TRINITY_DN1289_c0_g1_i1.p1 TRINITY_DN1289_c0_g1~~TRINITY_DN1289_c0_g1_i1.p1  ORF type:complete len:257 (-),score=31.34 TRINITY_DN1289_c0_g1_i1:632-1402(-)